MFQEIIICKSSVIIVKAAMSVVTLKKRRKKKGGRERSLINQGAISWNNFISCLRNIGRGKYSDINLGTMDHLNNC